jgi:hypothetical protein
MSETMTKPHNANVPEPFVVAEAPITLQLNNTGGKIIRFYVPVKVSDAPLFKEKYPVGSRPEVQLLSNGEIRVRPQAG